jgi:signal transduction histidine kinase
MDNKPIRILLVEDNQGDARLIEEMLKKTDTTQYELSHRVCLDDALKCLGESSFDILLLDLTLPDSQGIESFNSVYKQIPALPIVVLTGLDDEELAVKAVSSGAQDYIIKGQLDFNLLVRSIRYAIERKQIEEDLRNRNQELENFGHVLSHDLKTSIISIQGFSSRLLKDYQEELGDKYRNYLERIRISAKRMELMVSDILALSKIGQVVSTFDYFPSAEIIKDITANLQDRLQEKGIEFVVAQNLPTIYCDRERIYQVFENLTLNAIKFILNTDNPKIEIIYEDKGEFHQFEVRDNGIGIDRKYHQKIFEMFHRLKEIEDEEGTGLGLAIVDRIVSNHGGKVWVESENGKGATFYFIVPKFFKKRG